MTSRRPRWRRAALALADVFGTPIALATLWPLRASSRRVGAVLMYHAVDDIGGDPEADLVPATASAVLEGQIGHVARHYNVVRAGELRTAVARRRRWQRYPVAFTFDDDYRCHVTTTLPMLRRAGIAATFVLTGASLEGPFSFWWQRLVRARQRGHDVGAYEASFKQLDPASRALVEAALAEAAGPDPVDAGLRATEVRQLTDAGMEIGFHTLRHDNLLLLPESELERAMRDGRNELEQAAGRPLEIICYPYGSADERVAAAARAAGYTSGFTAGPGVITPNDDPMLGRRIGATQRSTGALAVQLVLALILRSCVYARLAGSGQMPTSTT